MVSTCFGKPRRRVSSGTSRATTLVGQVAGLGIAVAMVASAAAEQVGPDAAAYRQAVGRAIEYFEQAQGDDGSYSKQNGIGVTALVADGLMRVGRTPADPLVARSLKFIESQ